MRPLLLVLFIVITLQLPAQNRLVFTRADSSRAVVIKTKDLVGLLYNGYMQRPQQATGFVSSITDSSITLTPRKKLFQKKQAVQTLLISDITGFRKYSRFRPAGEVIYAVLGIGITGGVSAIISNSSSSAAMSFLGPVATGVVTASLRNLFFSDKVKNHTAAGWNVAVLPVSNEAVQ